MATAVSLRSGMSRKIHVPFCRAVGGVTRLLTLITAIADPEENLATFGIISKADLEELNQQAGIVK